MAEGAIRIQQKLKDLKNEQASKDKMAVLGEIKRSQAKKKCSKIFEALHPQNNYTDLEKLRAATWNGIPETLP